MLTTYHTYGYISNHFRRRRVAIIDMPWSCERGRHLGGRRERLQAGARAARRRTPVSARVGPEPRRPEPKEPNVQTHSEDSIGDGGPVLTSKSCHTGGGKCQENAFGGGV